MVPRDPKTDTHAHSEEPGLVQRALVRVENSQQIELQLQLVDLQCFALLVL